MFAAPFSSQLAGPASVAPALPLAPQFLPLAIAGVFASVVAIRCAAPGVTYDGRDLNAAFIGLAALVGAGFQIERLTGFRSVGDLLQCIGIFTLVSIVASLAASALAIGTVPYVDAQLAHADAVLFPGLDWPAAVRGLTPWSKTQRLLTFSYTALNWLPFFLILGLCFFGPRGMAKRFIVAWSIGLLFCVLPFHWFPAIGALRYFGLSPADLGDTVIVAATWDFGAGLEALRSPGPVTLGVGTLGALVTFPSFHACGAIVLAWGCWHLPCVRWPLLVLNALMWASAFPIGGHYIVDIIAGSAVAALAIFCARRARCSRLRA